MKKLPEAETYEEGLEYWPYRISLQTVIDYVCENAPENSKVVDVMCGPGYLLGKIGEKRTDVSLVGMDIDKRYISHGKIAYPNVSFEEGDILTWKPKELFDVVLCTGSLHHIRYEQQEKILANIASLSKPGGLVIISDAYIDNYTDEVERKQAAAKLGYEYIRETIRNKASDKVISWTIDILYNDVFMHEFKTSVRQRQSLLEKYFAKVDTLKAWPDIESEYGDYVHICKVI